MDKEYFINSNQLDHQTWQSLSSSIEIQPSQTPDCFLSPQPSAENLLIRELIGRLGNICNSSEIATNAPPSLPPYIGGGGCCSTNNSSYSTPLSSPPKIGMQIMDHLVKDNYPCLGNSIALGSTLPAMPGDPGFAERAARFSSFGSRSFNGRTTQFGANNTAELGYRSNNNNNNNNNSSKLQRVSSSPLLKVVGSQAQNLNDKNQNLSSELKQGELINSRENSSVSGPNPGGDNAPNRKRKAAPKGKTKETQCKIAGENGEDSSAKRSKSEEVNRIEEAKTEENRGDEGKKHNNSSQKPPEPPKDYIHVRARRGQATDSHSLAERVRREKISERMKLLQDLVPGCNKVTGKALMLDEIINYVQSLQRQVEFLSMKLATVNPRLDFNVDNLFSKDHVIQPNCSIQHPMYPLQSLTPTLYGQPHQNGLQNTSSSLTNEGSMVPFSMDPLNPTPNQNHALQLPPIDGFPNVIPQLSSLCEGDLQSIVQMSYGQNENEFQSQHLHGPCQTPLMKIEF